jgi:hypothetical protein
MGWAGPIGFPRQEMTLVLVGFRFSLSTTARSFQALIVQRCPCERTGRPQVVDGDLPDPASGRGPCPGLLEGQIGLLWRGRVSGRVNTPRVPGCRCNLHDECTATLPIGPRNGAMMLVDTLRTWGTASGRWPPPPPKAAAMPRKTPRKDGPQELLNRLLPS